MVLSHEPPSATENPYNSVGFDLLPCPTGYVGESLSVAILAVGAMAVTQSQDDGPEPGVILQMVQIHV